MTKEMFMLLKEGTTCPQIVCFPYLGGYSTTFYETANELGDEYEIWSAVPPGHGISKVELIEDIDQLVDRYYNELKDILKPDSCLLGYSMGGVIAYYVAQRFLEDESVEVKPKALIISACGAPRAIKGENNSLLSDKNLVKKLISYGAMPKEFLEEEELIQMFVPAFRADYRVLESAAEKKPEKLPLKAYMVWGEHDAIEPMANLLLWQEYLADGFTIVPVKDAEHMFISQKLDSFVKVIENIVSGTIDELLEEEEFI